MAIEKDTFLRFLPSQDKSNRVLFIYVESACRSQMAEGFFNVLADGKIVAKSTGNKPAERVNSLAVEVDE